MANKYNPGEWQWACKGIGTKLVSEMTKEELQQALCRTIDMLEIIQDRVGTTADKINEFMKDG